MLFKIVTDSSCNLPAGLIEQYDLEILSLTYYIGEKAYPSYLPGRSFDAKTFYETLRSKTSVTTSLVSPDAAYRAFDRLLSEGNDVLYIGFSSGLSGTYQTVSNVLSEISEKYPERKCFAVDTLAASLGQGLLVHYASQLRMEGKTIEETRDWLEENKLRLAHWFTVDDLFFLKRGGRISGATALLGTLIGIKPVMHMDDEGHLINVEKARGRSAALRRMCDKMEETAIEPKGQIVYISHGDCEEDAKKLQEMIEERMGVKSFLIDYVEPVIGSHSGPGTLALFFMARHR